MPCSFFNCVGTPAHDDGACDLSQVREVARQIGKFITEYKIIVNKSTVPVGTADEVQRIIREEIAKTRLEPRVRRRFKPPSSSRKAMP